MNIALTVKRSDVYKEVAQTTSYTGAKMSDDATAYERIYTTDEDESQLSRFWDESRAEVAKSFARLLSGETFENDEYILGLEVSSSFDSALLDSMQLSLFSYFVQSITAKWYVFTNKTEAGAYADRASVLLDDVREKAFHKKKPTRPTYD